MARRRKQEFEMISDSDRDPALMAYLAESEDAYYAALTEFLDEREESGWHTMLPRGRRLFTCGTMGAPTTERR